MGKVNAVIVDMDGTLADVSAMRHFVRRQPKNFDAFHAESVNVPPNPEAVRLVRMAHARGLAVVVVTARRARWRHHTAWWLALHDIPSDALIMRGDQDMRPDVEVKRDILRDFIRPAWNPVLAIDDNPAIVDLWMSEFIPTVQIPGWED